MAKRKAVNEDEAVDYARFDIEELLQSEVIKLNLHFPILNLILIV